MIQFSLFPLGNLTRFYRFLFLKSKLTIILYRNTLRSSSSLFLPSVTETYLTKGLSTKALGTTHLKFCILASYLILMPQFIHL